MRSSYSPFEILHISTSFIFSFIKIFHITAMPLVSYFCPESFIFLRYPPVFKILERGESHYSIVCEEYSRNVVRREGAPFIFEFMHFHVQHLWSCHSWNGMQSAKLKLKGSIISMEMPRMTKPQNIRGLNFLFYFSPLARAGESLVQ